MTVPIINDDGEPARKPLLPTSVGDFMNIFKAFIGVNYLNVAFAFSQVYTHTHTHTHTHTRTYTHTHASYVQPKQAAPAASTVVTVKLVKVDAAARVKAIKAVKDMMTDMTLVQAKKFVEELPQVIKKDVSKEEAAKIKEALAAAGGEVVFE